MDKKCIYVRINEQTVLLTIISKLLNISYYKIFLLYETFGNDIFFFFNIFKNYEIFSNITQYRIRRYHKQACSIARAVNTRRLETLSVTEKRTYGWLKPMIIDNMFKFIEEPEKEIV